MERGKIKRFLWLAWLRICNLVKSPRLTERPLRDKSKAVAETIAVIKDGDFLKACCPVCLVMIRTSFDSDPRHIIAVHMSLWHHDYVQQQWKMLQNNGGSDHPMPYFALGVAIGAGFMAAMAIWSRNRVNSLAGKREMQVAFQMRK